MVLILHCRWEAGWCRWFLLI